MEQQKLSPTTVYVLSVLSLLCCCFGGLGFIFSGIGLYIAQNKLNQVKADPDDYEPNSVKAMNTAKIIATVMLIINILYLCWTIYRIYTIGWDVIMERAKDAMEQMRNQ